MNTNLKNNLIYGGMALLAALCWGLSSVLIKVALESFSPMYIMAFRFTTAAICFCLFFYKRIRENLINIEWIPCIFIGIFLSIMNITVHYSLNMTGATTATFFFSIPAVFTPFIGYLLFKYPFRSGHLLVGALVILGRYMLCNTENGFSFGWGELLATISSLAFAFGMVWQNRYLPRMDEITVAAIQTVFIAFSGWLLVLPTEGLLNLSAVKPVVWLIILFLGIFGAFLTAIFQNISINHVNADFVSVIFTMEPVFTAIIAFFALGEKLTPVAMVGGVLILAGVIIITLFGNKSSTEAVFEKENFADKDN